MYVISITYYFIAPVTSFLINNLSCTIKKATKIPLKNRFLCDLQKEISDAQKQ